LIQGHAVAAYYKTFNNKINVIIGFYGCPYTDRQSLEIFLQLKQKIKDLINELVENGNTLTEINIFLGGDYNIDMEKLSKPRSVHFFKEMCNYFNIKNVDSANDEPTFHGYGIRNVSSQLDYLFSNSVNKCITEKLHTISDHMALIYRFSENSNEYFKKSRTVKDHILLQTSCLMGIQDKIIEILIKNSIEYKYTNLTFDQIPNLSYIPEKLEAELSYDEDDMFSILNDVLLACKKIYDFHDKEFYKFKKKEHILFQKRLYYFIRQIRKESDLNKIKEYKLEIEEIKMKYKILLD